MSLRKRRGKVFVMSAVGALSIALAAPFLVASAGANTLVSGSTTLSTVGTVTTDAPYSSGQEIDISVSSNSTLDLSNLSSYGYSSEPPMKAVECSDPDGTVANLPSTPLNNCDGQTIDSTSLTNSDGSFNINDFTMYALPDNATFGENADQTPVCGVGTDACVLYLGPAQNNFSQPHLFSAPFYVYPNGDDGGENPGDGSAQQTQTVSFTSDAPSPGSVGGTYTPAVTGGSSGNPVVLSIGSGSCTVSSGTVTFTGTGSCVIDANQDGNFQYAAAPQVTQSVTVDASAGRVNGPSTLATTGTVTPAAPYSSGQPINISVTANSTLDLSNLSSYGYSSEPPMKAVECSDPDGTVANLPTTPTDNCDGQTIDSTSLTNADGSFNLDSYTVYALPDQATFGENPHGAPVCGVGTNACVLYLGPSQSNFSIPHLFSAPFYVYANGDDGGENPGDGSNQLSQAITFTSSAPNPGVQGGTYVPTADGGASGNSVVFSIGSGPCSISSGTVTFTGGGTCVIDANQAGNFQYAAAPQVTQSVTVYATQTITFTSSAPNPGYIDGTYTPMATGGGSGNSVVFSIGSGPCSISSGTVTFTGPGTCVIDANQAGGTGYGPASQATQDVTVANNQSQTIHFTSTPPNPAVEGTTYTPTATGGGSGNSVVFSIGSGPCSISHGTVTFTASGTCVIDANQAGGNGYAAAAQATQSVTVSATGFTSANHTTATVGQSFSFPVTTAGSPKIKSKGKLPKGVKFYKGTGSARFAGTPTSTKHKSAAGTYTLTLTATYGKGKTKQVVTQTFTLTVNP